MIVAWQCAASAGWNVQPAVLTRPMSLLLLRPRPLDMATPSLYRDMLREKQDVFWRSKQADAGRHSPHKLWRSVDVIMDRGRYRRRLLSARTIFIAS